MLIFLIAAAMGSLMVAWIVQFATHLTFRFKPPFWMAYNAVILGMIASIVVGLVIGTFLATTGKEITSFGRGMLMIVGFLIQTAIFGYLIRHPETGSIGFRRACVVSLIQLVIGIAAYVSLAYMSTLITR
jgi:hypothetical protein